MKWVVTRVLKVVGDGLFTICAGRELIPYDIGDKKHPRVGMSGRWIGVGSEG